VPRPLSLNEYLNPGVIDSIPEFTRAFQSGQPFRHVVIDNFLAPAFCGRMCDQFPAFDEAHARDENERIGGKATRESVRTLGDAYAEADDLVQHPDFLSLVERITDIRNLHYDPYYFGGGTHENRQGQDLDPHIDFNFHPVTQQHRRLNLIIYLNPEWDDSWGGSLQLHRNPYREPEQDEIVTVTPLMNRCVIFETSERSWHGFEAIDLPESRQDLSRKSFAVYYYTDTRPADETAEEHSTVYVERHLPPRFREGVTLGARDVDEIKALLTRRDQHLKRLYADIQQLRGQLNRLRYRPEAVMDMPEDPEDYAGDIGEALRMIHMLRGRVLEMEASTSWRITAPVRALKRLISGRGRQGGGR
jgi:hypothetical protein